MHNVSTSHAEEPLITERALSDRINISTRQAHTTLNRLILARLPLSLPPYTHDSTTYAYGLLHILPIYSTFEQLWHSVLDSETASLKTQIHTLLSDLHLPGLARTARLQSDIQVCSRNNVDGPPINHHLPEINGKVAEFVRHIRRSVESRPHVLVAYAWVLYMALFAGGRFLRVTLQSAGSEFWVGTNDNPMIVPSRQGSLRKTERRPSFDRARTEFDELLHKRTAGLEFFHFDGDHDGEDIKAEFKQRITSSDVVLTAKEKDDVVEEGQIIFQYMVDIVKELDSLCGTACLPVGRLAKSGTRLESQDQSLENSGQITAHSPEKMSFSSPAFKTLLNIRDPSIASDHFDVWTRVTKLIHALTRTCTTSCINHDITLNNSFASKPSIQQHPVYIMSPFFTPTTTRASVLLATLVSCFLLGLYFSDLSSTLTKIPMF